MMDKRRDGVYRDPSQALRERIVELDRQIAKLEGSFSSVFWKSAAPDIDVPPPRTFERVDEGSNHDALMRAFEQREHRLQQLEGVLEDIEALERYWEQPRFAIRETIPLTLSAKTSPLSAARLREFQEMMQLAVPGATIEPRGKAARRVRFVDGENNTFELLCTSYIGRLRGNVVTTLTIRTTVPRLLGACRISSRSVLKELLISLRLLHPITTGDPSFDDFFVVGGDVETAKAILSPWVRMHLVDLAWNAAPTLTIGEGEARLERRWTADIQSIRSALAALRGVRSVPEGFGLRSSTEER
jgi:hypothetical protein